MPRDDDDFDDFSHLPSVDETPSAEDKKALWEKHGREPPHRAPEPLPEHSHREEVMEAQLLAHELPVEQTFAEEHPQHAPEWAEEGYVERPAAGAGVEDYIIEEPPPVRDGYVIQHPEVDPHRGSITQALRAQEPVVETRQAALESGSGDWVREAFEQAETASPPTSATPTKRLTLTSHGSDESGRPSGQEVSSQTPTVPPPEKGDVKKRKDKALPAAKEGDALTTEKLPPRADDVPLPRSPKKERIKGRPQAPLPAGRLDDVGTLPSHDDEAAADAKARRATDDDGGEKDAASHSPVRKGEVPHGIPHEPEPELTPKEKLKKTWEKMGGRALAASVVVHVVLLTLAAVWIVTYATEKEVDFLPGGGSKGASQAAEALQHKVQRKRNTWLRNKQPLKRVVSTSMATSITLPDAPPDMDFPDATKLIGGKGLSGGGFGTSGMGKGFGSGLGFGGKISFMGNSGVGRHIVFAVDVSASMSATGDSGTGQRISRMQLLRNELAKSISRLPPSTFYQVIYFSDFAWPHNEVDSRNLAVFDKYRWTITPDKTTARIPKFSYLLANPTNVARSVELIKDADNPGGTNWGSGLCMALSGFPKPDIVFFMTDGVKLDAEGWVDAVSAFNLKGGKRSIIHTTAMMEPDAALELDQLAKRNGGNFTIVTAKGFTVTGDEYFKGSK